MTRFWPDHNFAWYLSVSEVNTDLAPGHFQNYGVVQLSLDFWRALKIEFLKNTTGLNWGTMYDLRDLVKYHYTSLVRKLQ